MIFYMVVGPVTEDSASLNWKQLKKYQNNFLPTTAYRFYRKRRKGSHYIKFPKALGISHHFKNITSNSYQTIKISVLENLIQKIVVAFDSKQNFIDFN